MSTVFTDQPVPHADTLESVQDGEAETTAALKTSLDRPGRTP